jgi:hypothetical protein
MFRLCSLLALCAWLLIAPLRAQPQPSTTPRTQRYTLPPGKYEQAVAHSHAEYLMYFAGTLWAAGSLLLILRTRVAPKLRTWAVSASRMRFLQACMFVPALLLVWDAAEFPLDLVQQWIQLH